MSCQPPPGGHPPGRVPILARVPGLLRFARAVRAQRKRSAMRFCGPADGLRLVGLGGVLISLAALALAPVLFDHVVDASRTGFPALFGGGVLCVFILKLAWPAPYLDWLAVGILYVMLGALVADDRALASGMDFALFCTLFLTSAALRAWIALTSGRGQRLEASLSASAVTGLFCVLWLVVTRGAPTLAGPDFVLSIDVLIFGVSIAGFGLLWRKEIS